MQRFRTFAAVAVLCLAAAQSIAAQDWDPPRRWRHRRGVQVRVARDYHLPANQIASSPVIVVGGSAIIEGRVDDDFVVIGGPVRVGPAAQIRGNLVSLGGQLDVADTAEIYGEIHDIGILWPDIRFAVSDWLWGIDRGWWAAFTLAGTVFRFTLVMLVSCLLALVAPELIRRIGDRIVDAPVASGFIGVATQMLIVPILLVVVTGMVLTIVGIPFLLLLPFVVFAFLIWWLAGFASVAALVGGRLRSRVGLSDPGAVLDVAWGVALIFAITFAANLLAFGPSLMWPLATSVSVIGFVIEYLAWTIGLGAALLAPLNRRWGTTPPPIPSAASVGA